MNLEILDSGNLGSTLNLFFWSSILTGLGFVSCIRNFSFSEAAIISIGRGLLFFLYFAFFYNANWTEPGSDVTKFYTAAMQVDLSLKSAYEAFTLSTVPNPTPAFIGAIGFKLIGLYYWAPIWLYTYLSFLTTNIVKSIGIKFFGNEKQASWVAIFFCFHPDTLAWTSVVGLRESVMALSVAYIYNRATALLIGEYKLQPLRILLDIAVVFVCYKTRYYVLPILGLAIFVSIVLFWKDIQIIRVKNGCQQIRSIVVVLCFIFGLYMYFTLYSFPLEDFRPSGLVYAIGTYTLGPLPLRLPSEYTFLLPGAAVLFALLPIICFIIIVGVYRNHVQLKIMLVTLLSFSFVHGIFGLGPRHRYQISFTLIILEFAALALVVRFLSKYLQMKLRKNYAEQARDQRGTR